MSSMGKIMISYRRQDSADVSCRIYEWLEEEFGRNSVFLDVDSIPCGVDFRKQLDEEVAKCDVFIAVIGPDWMGAKDSEDTSRLEDPEDFVRIEIESALTRKIPVIPVLVRGAKMPTAERLPPSMQDLRYRHGMEVRPGTDFHSDMNELIKRLKEDHRLKDKPRLPNKLVAALQVYKAKLGQTQPLILGGIALIALIGIVVLITIGTEQNLVSGKAPSPPWARSKETCEKLIGDYQLWGSYTLIEEQGIKATSEKGTWKAKSCEESSAPEGMYILNGEEKTEQKVEVKIEINGKYEHVAQAENDSRSKLTIDKEGRLVDRQIYYEREGPFNGVPKIRPVRETEQVWKKHEGHIRKKLAEYEVLLEDRHLKATKNMHCIPTRGKKGDNRDVIAFTCVIDPSSSDIPKYTRVMVKQN
jgi:TIR domain